MSSLIWIHCLRGLNGALYSIPTKVLDALANNPMAESAAKARVIVSSRGPDPPWAEPEPAPLVHIASEERCGAASVGSVGSPP